MKLQIKNKMIGLIITGSILTLSSCSNPEEIKAEVLEGEPISYEYQLDEYEVSENSIQEMESLENNESEVQEIEPPTIDEESIETNTISVNTIVASQNVNVRSLNTVESDRLGLLVEGRNLTLLSDEDPKWYQVDYYGQVGYVLKDYAYQSTRLEPIYPIIYKGYINENTSLYNDKELTDVSSELPFQEFAEVYKELDNSLLIRTIDGFGYIDKTKLEKVEGNIAVVDISNQELRLYQDDSLVMITPVVTGTYQNASRESDKGLYEIFKERHNLWITESAYVNNMLNYNRGEGLHDAHRWRQPYEFGGCTYLTNGSHGCINMPLDAANYASEVLDVGDKVLVKQ